MSLTVGRLARKYGLSRTTLLYYDSIGLLSPAGHGKGEYRRYTPADGKRLEQICLYRRAGVSLKDIRSILDGPPSDISEILGQRFAELGAEIERLREQQRVIAGLLRNAEIVPSGAPMSRELWVELLRASGFSEEDMDSWHRQFERTSPDRHEQFLRHLNIPEEEVAAIRAWSGKQDPDGP
jgi:DNA-binding transcriptional MerR regulator